MEQAWIIMGETYLLTIVISLFVAFLIHMMTLLIRRFGTAAKPLPVSAEQVEISAQPDDPHPPVRHGGEAVAGLGGAGRNIGTAG